MADLQKRIALTPEQELAELKALIKAQGDQIAMLRNAREADRVGVQKYGSQNQESFSKRPWEEEIFAECLFDCTYPNKDDPDNYAVYRRGRTETLEGPKMGEVIRLKHREHLNSTLRELTKDEAADYKLPAAPRVPQSGARSQRSAYVRG